MLRKRFLQRFFATNKCLIIMLCIMIALSFCFISIVSYSVSNHNGITIILDAGHGARDGGSIGVNGTIEKDINLKYTLALKEKLIKAGYYVELTRSNDEPLYSPLAKNKKMSDMKYRINKIKKVNPNLVISIHMNSFSNSSVYGANTYFRAGDEASKNVANLIQKSFNKYINAPNSNGKVGDYFILNESYYTSVLIECGFLSNPEEEQQLNNIDYQNKLLDAVVSAVMLYFGNYLLS